MTEKGRAKNNLRRIRAALCCMCFIAPVFLDNAASAQLLTGYGEASHPAQENNPHITKPVPRESAGSPGFLTGYKAAAADTPVIRAPRSAMQKFKAKTEAEKKGASPVSGEVSDDPVDLQADSLTHDEQSQIITASGNVMLAQSGRILRADEIRYNLQKDTVVATGHVVLNEENGDIHYAEKVTFNNKLKDGFVKGLKTFLADGSRFTAVDGERRGGVTTTMNDATYTPCEPCKEHPDRPPVWQIRASRVTHDSEERRISYNNARFEIFGIPVAYTPYFAHPDGSIKQKSGFLAPSGGYKSELGAFVTNRYYWAIGPDRDATIGITAMTEEAPLAVGEYRQRWANAEVKIEGSATYSERTESKNGSDVVLDADPRGHVFGEALWDINNKWRAGADIELSSDRQYLRQYDFSGKDVLENELYVERFSGRDYAAGRVLAFQDLRIGDLRVDQPDVLPEITAGFIGEPDSVPLIGGRWNVNASALGLRRGGDNQDMNRVSGELGWQRRFVSDVGLLTRTEASVRGDLYSVRDRDIATKGSGRSRESEEARVFPQAHIEASYPVAKQFEKAQLTIEPVAALTVATNVDVNDDIPNEDSQDVQIDAGNLFEPNRFPGFDRVEDKSRATYGLRTGIHGEQGSYIETFLGQSRRFDNDDNPFPEGSGLNSRDSDVVGQISAQYDDIYSADYRFQLDSNNYASQRHEVEAAATWSRLSLQTRYLFAEGLEGTEITESREQIDEAAAYYLTKDWRLLGGATHDLGKNPGLRKAYVGLDYFGHCVFWSLTGEKNLTADASGDSNTEILFRIGLKNIGEFETSGIRLDGSGR